MELNVKKRGKNISRLFMSLMLLSIFLIFSAGKANASTVDNDVLSSQEVEIETVFINEKNLTIEKLEQIHEENQSKNTSQRAITGTIVTAYVNRIGTGNTCQIYLRWDGNLLINTWRFTELTVRSKSIISNTLYARFSPFYKTVPAAANGTVFLGTFSVPTSQNRVRVAASGLQAYTLSNGWLSAIMNNGEATIN